MGIVVVLGSIMTDLVVRTPRLPYAGEALIGSEFATYQGGKGFNQAIAAARMGATVTLIGRVGSDTYGDAFFPILAQEQVDSSFVTRDPIVGTGLAMIMIGKDTGQNMIAVAPQANLTIPPGVVEQAIRKAATQCTSNDTGIFLAQCETNMSALLSGLTLAREMGMETILNAAPVSRETLTNDFFELVDILIVNETEARELTGIQIASSEYAFDAAEHLHRHGPEYVMITRGEQGTFWSRCIARDVPLLSGQIAPIRVKQVDATAAGDAFCGALAASLATGTPMDSAIIKANKAGAVAVTRMGAYPSLPVEKDIHLLEASLLLRAVDEGNSHIT